jgi:signal transduction histidine kinase
MVLVYFYCGIYSILLNAVSGAKKGLFFYPYLQVAEMSDSYLKGYLKSHIDPLSKELHRRLGDLPWNPWQEFFLRTEGGQRRFTTWLNLLVDASAGSTGSKAFFSDQERAAYERAIQGYQFKDFSRLYSCALESVNEIILKTGKKNEARLYKDFYTLFETILNGIIIVSTSTLKTREEILNEKVFHLESLHLFTQDIIRSLELKDILSSILNKSKSIFKARKSFISLYNDQFLQGIHSAPKGRVANRIGVLMEKSCNNLESLFIDIDGNTHKDINISIPVKIISVPIRAHDRCYGVLALESGKEGIVFSARELDLLLQILHISAIALENAYMFKEIEQSRQELRFLTEKMITIQEEERRRLAADIHDSVAQALTGIGYKIQVCRELIDKKPMLLTEQLDNLIRIVNNAIDQSRELISSLRPDLLDDIGLVAALKKFLETYSKETDIKIKSELPEQLQISPEMNICLFRVVQEALSNVYKHADTKEAEISIRKENGNVVLIVEDNGKGFEVSPDGIGKTGLNKIGLLSMKERVEATSGKLYIESAPNKGCRIQVRIPLLLKGKSDENN